MNPYIILAIVLSAFASGWQTNDWKHDSIELASEKAANKVLASEIKRESNVAKHVEIALRGVKTNERIIETIRQPIIQREVYSVECIDDDGLDFVNGVLPISKAKFETSTGILVGRLPSATTEGVWEDRSGLDSDGKAMESTIR